MSLSSAPFIINYNTQWTINNFYPSKNYSFENLKVKRSPKSKCVPTEEKPIRFFPAKTLKKSNFDKPLIFPDFEDSSEIGAPQQRMAEAVGYGLLVFVFIFFCWFALNFFGVLLDVEKEKGHVLLEEGYYCLLIPLILPVSLVAAYGNWIAVKFFRHN